MSKLQVSDTVDHAAATCFCRLLACTKIWSMSMSGKCQRKPLSSEYSHSMSASLQAPRMARHKNMCNSMESALSAK